MVAAPQDTAPTGRGAKRVLLGMGLTVAVVLIALLVAALALSGVSLAGDPTALARVSVQPLGGTILRVRAFGPGGKRVPIALEDGRLTPLKRLIPGERVTVDVQVRRPGWLSWALGSQRNEQLTLRAPVAHVTEQWMTVPNDSPVRVSFDQPVSAIAYGNTGQLTHHTLSDPQSSVSLGTQPQTGSVEIAAAARPWETVGTPTQVSWFPQSNTTVMATIPAAGAPISPYTAIRLTFSKTVSEALGSARPSISPSTPGRWRETDSHTLVFTPSGFGAPLDSHLRIQLPHEVAVATGPSNALHTTGQIEWTVPPGSTLRLQQLLAEQGYLPVDWQPSGAAVTRTPSAAGASRGRSSERQLQLALFQHPTPAAGDVESGSGQHDHPRRGDDVRAQQRTRGRRDRGADRLAHAARRRGRRQASRQRLQLRVCTPRRSRVAQRSGSTARRS